MSERKVQITVTVSADEAEALEKMSEAEKASLTETLTTFVRAASIRQKLMERGSIRTGDQVNESQGENIVRLDEVLGNPYLED